MEELKWEIQVSEVENKLIFIILFIEIYRNSDMNKNRKFQVFIDIYFVITVALAIRMT